MTDKKEYQVVGRVEIGTDEYRDLIEKVAEETKRADSYMRTGWEKDTKISNLEKELRSIKERSDLFDDFLKSVEKSEAFKAFIVQKRFEDMEDND